METILSVEGILNDLSNGFTRTTTTKNYNPEIGSIEEKYGLSKSEVSLLFKEPRLVGKKTITKKKASWRLVDTEEEKEAIISGVTTSAGIEEPIAEESSPEVAEMSEPVVESVSTDETDLF